jgi:hypothetical protein
MYRIKHIPTGLFYKPIAGTQTNLSKHGKIYATEGHAKSSYGSSKSIRIYAKEGSVLYRNICEKVDFQKSYNYSDYNKKMHCDAPISEWIIEKVKIQ